VLRRILMHEDEDYEVGYGKPPKASQFKPGQSGNPKGRPRKPKDFDGILDRELSQTIRITDGGESKTMTKREVLVKTLINAALKGERAALKLVLGYMKSHQTIEAFEPDAADHRALMALLEKSKIEDEEAEGTPDE
jgi:hypothetical protein